MQNKKEEKRKKSAASRNVIFSLLSLGSQFYLCWLSPHDFAWFLLLRNYIPFFPFFLIFFLIFLHFLKIIFIIISILLLSRLPHMDSPLSRSPGSSVFKGVGLPTTRPSSVLGGPQRLEYCCTPPHSSSLPALAALPAPPAPRLAVFQWPMECEVADAPPPIRVWFVPGLACQLVVGVRDWPCAKKRFTSSSPANSARMVVLPSTHLHRQEEITSTLSHTETESQDCIFAQY